MRAAVEMYTEDWIIAHRRWVGWGSSGWRVRRPSQSAKEPIVCGWPSCLSARRACKDSWTSVIEYSVGGWPCWHGLGLAGVSGCIREPGGPLVPATRPALPPPRYQHLSVAYSPVTTETQRERQKGLTRQVFEQDASGDEKCGLEDSVRGPWVAVTAGVCVWPPAAARSHIWREMTRRALNSKGKVLTS